MLLSPSCNLMRVVSSFSRTTQFMLSLFLVLVVVSGFGGCFWFSSSSSFCSSIYIATQIFLPSSISSYSETSDLLCSCRCNQGNGIVANSANHVERMCTEHTEHRFHSLSGLVHQLAYRRLLRWARQLPAASEHSERGGQMQVMLAALRSSNLLLQLQLPSAQPCASVELSRWVCFCQGRVSGLARQLPSAARSAQRSAMHSNSLSAAVPNAFSETW